MSEKLQKVLANLALGSRRQMEEWIGDGRVTVNNQVAKIGDRVEFGDKIQVNGRLYYYQKQKQKTQVLLYHKPSGEICTRSDEKGRQNVFASLPEINSGRWISIGRLDLNTSGLLLFTNDGELAQKLMHPSSQIEREYAVRILGNVSSQNIDRLMHGVKLSDGIARFEKIIDAGGEGINHWFHVVVLEGKNRLVRRLWESQGLTVSRLIRIRFGTIVLPRSLPRGRFMELSQEEISKLKNL